MSELFTGAPEVLYSPTPPALTTNKCPSPSYPRAPGHSFEVFGINETLPGSPDVVYSTITLLLLVPGGVKSTNICASTVAVNNPNASPTTRPNATGRIPNTALVVFIDILILSRSSMSISSPAQVSSLTGMDDRVPGNHGLLLTSAVLPPGARECKRNLPSLAMA